MGHLYTKCNNNIARFKAQASIDIISQNIITQFVAIANSEDSFALIDVAFHLSSVKKIIPLVDIMLPNYITMQAIKKILSFKMFILAPRTLRRCNRPG